MLESHDQCHNSLVFKQKPRNYKCKIKRYFLFTIFQFFFSLQNTKKICLCSPLTPLNPTLHTHFMAIISLLLLVIQQLFIWKLNKLKFLLCYYWDILTDSTQGFHPFVFWSIASHFSWHHTVWRCTVISEAERHLCDVAYVFRFKTTNPYL